LDTVTVPALMVELMTEIPIARFGVAILQRQVHGAGSGPPLFSLNGSIP
jgi:hypothetical protein